MRCPVCNNIGKSIYNLPKEFICESLGKYYSETIGDDLGIIDYEMFKCTRCTLEYAEPQLPGSRAFYQWIVCHPDYYPDKRWEWFEVYTHLEQKSSEKMASLLEVGCGAGQFLQRVKNLRSLKSVGIDTSPSAVQECRDRQLTVSCDSIESILNTGRYDRNSFDYCVSFHCLEHISRPKEFVISMLSVLKSDGIIFLSTPYSPMSFETSWHDPLNHPPHHITRWNLRAYEELALQLGLEIQVFMPDADRLSARIRRSLRLRWYNRSIVSNRTMLFSVLKWPLDTFREWKRQNARELMNGKCVADVVLVKLYRR